jgi:dipeptidyl aminopeptidase/acylaminoacyl peptidase
MTEDVQTLTAELIVDGAVPREPVISPDGRWIVYTVATFGSQTERRRSALWLTATGGNSPPRQLTAGTAADSGPSWAPDSKSLYFLSDRAGSAQAHRIRLDGGEAEALTDWRGEISEVCPLADARLVAVVATDEPTEDDKRKRAERDDAIMWTERIPRARLRLLDLETRELRVVGGLGGKHVVKMIERPGGGPLAVISWATPEIDPGASTAELHVVDPHTGAVHDLGRVELEASSLTWWSVDGAWHVSYLAISPPISIGGFALFDLIVPVVGAAEQHRNLTEGMAICPTHLVQVPGGAPLALFADGLDTALYRLDLVSQRFCPVSTREGRLDALSVSDSGDLVAVLASTSCDPVNVYAGPPGGPFARLSDTRPELRQIRYGTQERLAYQASDGLGLDGLLILPVGAGRESGPFPLITVVHGGPYDRYADQFYGGLYPPAQWLAAGGYAVFLPNPRGGMGHGHEFAVMVAGRVGLEEWTDIVGGIDHLVANGVADPDRLGIAGGSHGGFMAAWAVGQTHRFKAAMMNAGISDWAMLVATGDFGTSDGELGGSCGWEGSGPHRHNQLSPISYASKVRTPVLILHGQDDTNVPLGQSIYFHRALRQFGVEHDFVVYPREGHGLTERNHQVDALHRTRAWFDRWLSDL